MNALIDKTHKLVLDTLGEFKRVPLASVGFTSVRTDGLVPLHLVRRRPTHAREIIGTWIIDHAPPGTWRS